MNSNTTPAASPASGSPPVKTIRLDPNERIVDGQLQRSYTLDSGEVVWFVVRR